MLRVFLSAFCIKVFRHKGRKISFLKIKRKPVPCNIFNEFAHLWDNRTKEEKEVEMKLPFPKLD